MAQIPESDSGCSPGILPRERNVCCRRDDFDGSAYSAAGILATFSSAKIKKALSAYQLSREMDFETPPGSRPTLNSYLLWIAKNRDVPAASLWVPVPFYLMTNEDPTAHKKALEFLDKRMELGLDYSAIDTSIKKQNEKLRRLRLSSEEIDGYIGKLESNQRLSEEERENLVKGIGDYLRKRNN